MGFGGGLRCPLNLFKKELSCCLRDFGSTSPQPSPVLAIFSCVCSPYHPLCTDCFELWAMRRQGSVPARSGPSSVRRETSTLPMTDCLRVSVEKEFTDQFASRQGLTVPRKFLMTNDLPVFLSMAAASAPVSAYALGINCQPQLTSRYADFLKINNYEVIHIAPQTEKE